MSAIASSNALTWRAGRSAHGLDRVPESTRAQAQLEAPVRQQIQRRSRLRQHRRRAQRQVDNVGENSHAFGARGDGREQRPGVVEPVLIGMVLDADQVDARRIGLDRLVEHPQGLAGVRDEEVAELNGTAVVHDR